MSGNEENNNERFDGAHDDSGQSPESSNYPEPPANWSPQTPTDPNADQSQTQPNLQDGNPQPKMGAIGRTVFPLNDSQAYEFASARKFIMAAQITAIVSLFLGGVILSAVSIVLAAVANSKLQNVGRSMPTEEVRAALRRTGFGVLILCGVALVLNIISLIFIYPIVMQYLQTGDYGSLFGSWGGNAPAGTSGSSTWG